MKTSTYTWQGLNRQGRKTSGELTAASPALARAQLRKQGMRLAKLKRVGRKPSKPSSSGASTTGMFTVALRARKITPIHIMLFTRQLATMMKAGIPVVQAFEITREGLNNDAMRDLVTNIRDDVAAGNSLTEGVRRHPRYFDNLFCSLVEAGEVSGTLETMLDRLATHKEKSEALKSKIKKAMNYPLAVIAAAIVVTGVLLIKVVPRFAETFAGFGAELPAFTLLVLGLSDVAVARWWQVLVGGVLAVFLFRQARRRSKAFDDGLQRLSLKLPVIGPVLRNTCCARFTRTLATVFSAGVPLTDALDSVAGATGNTVYAKAVGRIRDDIVGGQQLSAAVRNTGLFPVMVIQMVSVGEESGTLDAMLGRCADYYEAEVDNAVNGLTALMEPAIMAILGTLVGGLMVAMYLPIFQLGQVI